MIKTMINISRWTQKILEVILLFIGTLLTLVNIAQIGGRNIFFYSLPWSEQLSTWLFIWIIFLGYHLVLIKEAELTIDVIHFSDKRKQLCLEILRDILSLAMIIVFFAASIQFMGNSIRFPQKLSSMPVNMYVIYGVMPVSFGIMIFQKFLNMLIKIEKLLGKLPADFEGGSLE